MDFLPHDKAFMHLSKEDSIPPEQCKTVLIPFGLEKSVTWNGGTAKGPQAILDASPFFEFFDEVFWCEPYRDFGIATLEEPKIADKLEDALTQIENIVGDVLNAGKFPLVLGGEHSLTPGAIRSFVKDGEPLTILQFDAHTDLRDGYEGHRYSHAAAMCRCLDFPNVRIVSVGIRGICADEIPILEANKDRVTIFWAKDKKKWTVADVAKAVGTGRVYITFDLDGFDTSLMPATGTPDPGGLFWDEAMEILEAATEKTKIVGADVVELAPAKGFHACDLLAARLTYKILCYAMGFRPKAA
jgi:agmatinase